MTPPTALQIVTILHIACSAAWFGVGLTAAGRIRRSLQAGKTEALWDAADIIRTMNVSRIMGVITFLSGIALIFMLGGFKAVPKVIHMSMAIVLLMLVLGFVSQTIWKGAVNSSKESGDLSALQAARGKVAMFSGIQQLLWLVTLGMMVTRMNS